MDNTHTTYIYIYTPNYIIDKDIIYIYLSWITHTHHIYIYIYIHTPNYIIDKDIIYIYLSWITHTHTPHIYIHLII